VAGQDFGSVGDYIESFPASVQAILRQARQTILDAAPAAAETISYKMLAFTLEGTPLLYVAGWKRHISLYPAPAGDAAFERRLAPYRAAKSTLKFPLSQPIPYDLIRHVVELRLAERQAGPPPG
jgi:uncharacterized protein YdhG (YjbR/CyaY superfamily)